MVQILPSNTFTTAKWIVSATASDGTHTTIASALASASSGDTVFIRTGSYTENPTLKAGVNLAAYDGDGSTPNVTIIGKCTFTAAGSVSISNIRLQTNSDFALAVTGSAASVVYLNNCNLNFTNNTGISFSTSSGSANIYINDCTGDLGTTGIAFHSSSSAGNIRYYRFFGTNSGASTTASANSAGVLYMFFCYSPHIISTSSTGNLVIFGCDLDTSAVNTTAITHNGGGAPSISNTYISSGTASCISVGVGSTLSLTTSNLGTSNGNSVTGSGTINYGFTELSGNTGAINATTSNALLGSKLYTTAGITFDNTNILSSYAVGTWTPTITGGSVAGTTTYVTQVGNYVQIGNVVTATGNVSFSAATGTGNVLLGGLPVTQKNVTNLQPVGAVSIVQSQTWPSSTTSAVLLGAANTVLANINISGSAATSGNLVMANIAQQYRFTLTYEV